MINDSDTMELERTAAFNAGLEESKGQPLEIVGYKDIPLGTVTTLLMPVSNSGRGSQSSRLSGQ